MAAYTYGRKADVERAVEAVITRSTEAVVAGLRPAAVLLSGSFARGEGGAYMRDDGLHLTSDVDLVAVFKGPASLARAVLSRPRASRLASRLSDSASGTRVDLATRPAALLHWPSATLDTYELLRCARTLHGDVHLAPPSAVRQDDIPTDELDRLLFKRGAGLLVSWVRLMTAADPLPPDEARVAQHAVSKAILACGDSWLLRHRAYDHRLARRVDRLRRGPRGRLRSATRLPENYQRAARSTLLPGAVEPSRPEHLKRWHSAARIWLECRAGLHSWHRPTPNRLAPWRPTHVRRQIIPFARRFADRLTTPRSLHRGLPTLLRRTLDRCPDGDAAAVATVCRFLLTWDRGGAREVASRGMEWAGVT